jgi:hypothetical protein
VTTLGELTASIAVRPIAWAHVAQALTELAQALACPKQQRLRIVPGLWLDQRAKIIEQTRIRLAQRLATATGPADPLCIGCLARAQFRRSMSDRAARDAHGAHHRADAGTQPSLPRPPQTDAERARQAPEQAPQSAGVWLIRQSRW